MKALFRYNLRILLGNTVWLLVIPIGSSQLIVVWNMAVANLFNTSVAARTTELLVPLWAALLCSHILGQEYRSQLSEMTFSKPLSVNRIVALRLVSVFTFIGLLALITLGAYRLWLQPYDFLSVALAGIPSTLALGMMAMVLSALWRDPMMGFAGAALYWALDMLSGLTLNPLLSLHSFAESTTVNPLAEHWRLSKVILIVVALGLYLSHGRMVSRPAGTRSWRTVVKSGTIPLLLFAFCILSGAVYKLFLGLRHEAQLPDRAWQWYYEQFRVYGPFPAAWMFGPAFAYYVDQPLPGGAMRNEFPDQGRYIGMRMTRWKLVASRYPRSRWAPHSAFELARDCDSVASPKLVPVAVQYYELISRDYPDSPFAPLALSRLNVLAGRTHMQDKERWAQQRLMERYPTHPLTWPAVRQLAENTEKEGGLAEMLPRLRRVAESAPITTKPSALLFIANKVEASGQTEESRGLYQRALSEARTSVRALQSGALTLTPAKRKQVLIEMDRVIHEAQKAIGQG